VEEERPVILIVEDDLDVADMLTAYFNVQGYEVRSVNWGDEAVRACIDNPPKLVILDIRLPDVDGFEVARRLRRNRRTANIPIIFLTEKRGRMDRLQGLELGADDYITKPFDVQELRLRVRNALQRSAQGAVNNPITNLPEGQIVDNLLGDCLNRQDWGILHIAILNLKSFRDLYGFVAADDVLRAISLIISNAIKDRGSEDDFIGQLGAVDFLVITQVSQLPVLEERVQSRLDQAVEYFYPLKDREEMQKQPLRLGVTLKRLAASDGPFKDLESLKQSLLA
jgi:PleD family two-component response regulator